MPGLLIHGLSPAFYERVTCTSSMLFYGFTMDKRRIIWTLLALTASAVAISGVADHAADTYAEDALKRALVTFAAARTLNGVISVVQSTEVGVGVTVSVGQILDPINDLVEQFSSVMLVAASSLGLQNVLLTITASRAVTVALVIASIFVDCYYLDAAVKQEQSGCRQRRGYFWSCCLFVSSFHCWSSELTWSPIPS